MIGNTWQGRKSSDAKDGCAKELGGSGEKTQFMEVVCAQVVPCRVPLPLPLAAGPVVLGRTDKVVSVLMMMAAALVGPDFKFGIGFINKLLNSPAEAAGVVGVYSLQDEQH